MIKYICDVKDCNCEAYFFSEIDTVFNFELCENHWYELICYYFYSDDGKMLDKLLGDKHGD